MKRNPVWKNMKDGRKRGDIVTPATMQLGDTVVPLDTAGYYNFYTCVNINDKTVTLFRPYVHVNPTQFSGRGENGHSCVAYVGITNWELMRDFDHAKFTLIDDVTLA